MKNFKKTLSLAMAAVFTVSTVFAGNPVETVQAKTSKAVTVTLSTKKTAKTLTKTLKGKGHKITLKAVVGKKKVSATKVTYKSSKTSVATVSKKGVVTSKANGSSTITLTYKKGKKTYTRKVKVTVSKVKATKVKLSKTAKTIAVGDAVTLKATLSPSNSTDTVTWKSSKPKVATVVNGKVTALKVGTTTITATSSSGKKATCKVTVNKPIKTLKLDVKKLSLEVGAGYTLTPKVTPKTTTDKITYSSDKPYVCKVNKTTGHMKAFSTGTATITAKAGSLTATCKVTVTGTKAVESVTVTPETAEIQSGDTVQLTATVSPEDAKDKTLTWKSSDESIATVDANGLVTGVSGGITYITVAASNGKYAIATINVNDEQIEVTDLVVPAEVTVGKGLTQTIEPDITTNPADKASRVKLTWNSSDSSIATVDNNGVITGVAEGTTTVTVTAGNITKSINVIVAAASKAVQQGTQTSMKVDKAQVKEFTTSIPGVGNVVITPEQIDADCSTLKELTNQKWDNTVFYDALYSLKTKDDDGNSKFQSVAAFVDIVTASGEAVSVVDENEVKLNDIDCTGWWAAHSAAAEVKDAGLDISFKGTTYEDASANWNTPLFVVYTADEKYNGEGAISETPGYTEYFVGRADVYGWAVTEGQGEMPDAEKIMPADWEAWVNEFKQGKKGDLVARYDGDTLVVTFKNNGAVSTSYIKVDKTKPVYISLTGELCKVTDIVATERTFNSNAQAQVAKLITNVASGRKYDGEVVKTADNLKISVTGGAQDQILENIQVQNETGNETEHVVTFTMKGNNLTAHVSKEGNSLDLEAEKYGIKAPILHFVNSDTTFELEGNQQALEAMGLGSLLGALQATAK